MKIKEAILKRCSECNHITGESQPAIFGCDQCQKEVNTGSCLHWDITYKEWSTDNDSEHYTFVSCSWACVLMGIKQLERKNLWYINLPLLNNNVDIEDGIRLEDFLALLKE